jgi:hypothetical protein
MLMFSHACSFCTLASILVSGRVEVDDLPLACLFRGARHAAFGGSSVPIAEPYIKH